VLCEGSSDGHAPILLSCRPARRSPSRAATRRPSLLPHPGQAVGQISAGRGDSRARRILTLMSASLAVTHFLLRLRRQLTGALPHTSVRRSRDALRRLWRPLRRAAPGRSDHLQAAPASGGSKERIGMVDLVATRLPDLFRKGQFGPRSGMSDQDALVAVAAASVPIDAT
jgi:hypothetical protein